MYEFDLAHIGTGFADILKTVALCSLRLYVIFLVLPAMAGEAVQGMVRTGFVILVGLFIAAGMPAQDVGNLPASSWLTLAIKEAVIGLVLGFAVSTVFWVAECVGALVDTQAGYNNVQMTNPLSGQQSTPVSDMLLQLVIAVFFALGGMLVLLGAVFESFKVWPLLAPMPSTEGFSEVFFLREVDGLMTATVKFAAPVLLVLVLIDLGFGLVTRAADKLEPHSLAQPVKGAVAMLLLALLCGVFVAEARQHLLPRDLLPRLEKLLPH
ncbi:type III secretion system export apparatus subunit SctT [Ramlibacter tataouinensis]|uniref:Translocation protein-like protein n=1 Tax=Ramlibacter tataouinensis (strain ATCC BAA-407 / DSM 14655 / LMG 21543 / TTB310) TaxID=365046 RepID=F5XVY1_RAMTT|nr:type III secretion system export apparatus subunit SctT [Ramlibacter tataouinensis]AEG94084.1 translocation protein-like protein [Ramlibacter tataouinensis TTB310]